ncbi:hypothetical protein CFP65_6387 [Kitasatospora sp. MMS16-BH015]|uniref:AAA family ATPase n=1 Tax=Kitasatospora sp. MMS16-BH015 TaxID=2018025 RepID=UPI000CA09D26|nr:AAA family ATPase [Kitasatospora sp. MMS16-BH015]AUG81043.1 hypothetical protein CFP65_6387 [Kitasatospora sp. MMS16-BH015]
MRAQARAEIEEIAGEVAREVFRRVGEPALDQAVGDALGRELPGLAERLGRDVRREVAEAIRTADAEELRAIDAIAGEAVERLLDFRLTEYELRVRRIAGGAAREVLQAALPAAVDRLRAELAEATPPVVRVVLPTGRTVRLEADTHRMLPELLVALRARCHVLLVGPAGTGKSMLAKHAAEALGQELQTLSLGPTTPMSKVFGYYDAHGNYHDTPFRRAFEHGGVMLLDELDNGHPGLLGELNQALALRVCAFADGMVAAHEDFRLVATANTYGHGADHRYVGRQALDAATLDRFTVLDVPIDEKLEHRLVLGHAPSHQQEARQLLNEVRRLRRIVAEKGLPLVFSPRAGIDGARLLEAGASLDQVLRWRVTRGLSAAHRTALGLAEPKAAA